MYRCYLLRTSQVGGLQEFSVLSWQLFCKIQNYFRVEGLEKNLFTCNAKVVVPLQKSLPFRVFLRADHRVGEPVCRPQAWAGVCVVVRAEPGPELWSWPAMHQPSSLHWEPTGLTHLHGGHCSPHRSSEKPGDSPRVTTRSRAELESISWASALTTGLWSTPTCFKSA